MDFLRTDIALDEPPDDYCPLIKHKVVIEITYDDADLVVFVETALSTGNFTMEFEGYKENLKKVRLGSDLWALDIPHPDEVMDISLDNGYVRIKAIVTFEGTPDIMTLLKSSNKSRELKIVSMAVLKTDVISEIPSDVPNNLPGKVEPLQLQGHTPIEPKGCSQQLHPNAPQTPNASRSTFARKMTPPTDLSTMSWTIRDPESPSPAYRAVLPLSPTISSVTPTPAPSSPGSECFVSESAVVLERLESPDIENKLREEFSVILQERMFELQGVINEKDVQLRLCKEVVKAEFEKVLKMRMFEVQKACNDEVEEMTHKVRHARAWARKERKLRVEAEAHSWKNSIPKELLQIPVDGPGGLRDQLFAAKLEIELQKKRYQSLHEQLQESQEKVAHLTSEPGGDIVSEASSGNTNEATPIRGKGTDVVISNDVEKENAVMCCQMTQEQVACKRSTIRSQSAKLSDMLVKTSELRTAFFKRKVVESESLAANLLKALQCERRMRLDFEAQIREEVEKRTLAEGVAQSVIRESKAPFVVPGLLGTCLTEYGGLGKIGKDDGYGQSDEISEQEYGGFQEESDSDYEWK